MLFDVGAELSVSWLSRSTCRATGLSVTKSERLPRSVWTAFAARHHSLLPQLLVLEHAERR